MKLDKRLAACIFDEDEFNGFISPPYNVFDVDQLEALVKKLDGEIEALKAALVDCQAKHECQQEEAQ